MARQSASVSSDHQVDSAHARQQFGTFLGDFSEINPPLVNLKGKEVRAFTLRRISVALGQQEKTDVHFHLLVRICCVQCTKMEILTHFVNPSSFFLFTLDFTKTGFLSLMLVRIQCFTLAPNLYQESQSGLILHCKCLQGFTGSLRGNQSAGISNLWGLHVYPQSL